jgi:hypothetical protein
MILIIILSVFLLIIFFVSITAYWLSFVTFQRKRFQTLQNLIKILEKHTRILTFLLTFYSMIMLRISPIEFRCLMLVSWLIMLINSFFKFYIIHAYLSYHQLNVILYLSSFFVILNLCFRVIFNISRLIVNILNQDGRLIVFMDPLVPGGKDYMPWIHVSPKTNNNSTINPTIQVKGTMKPVLEILAERNNYYMKGTFLTSLTIACTGILSLCAYTSVSLHSDWLSQKQSLLEEHNAGVISIEEYHKKKIDLENKSILVTWQWDNLKK